MDRERQDRFAEVARTESAVLAKPEALGASSRALLAAQLGKGVSMNAPVRRREREDECDGNRRHQ